MESTIPQTDARGVIFDPAKHIPRLSKQGRWMPRSPGRKKKLPVGGGKTAAVPGPGSVEPLGKGAASSPVPPAAAPEKSAAQSPPPAPSFDDLPPVEPAEAVEASETRAPDTRSKADADIVCRLTQLGTGLVLDPEEARPSKADHENLVESAASVFRAKGWQLPAGLAALALGVIYFLSVLNKPRSREKFNRWLDSHRAAPVPKKAEPAGAPPPYAASADSVPLPPGIPPLARP